MPSAKNNKQMAMQTAKKASKKSAKQTVKQTIEQSAKHTAKYNAKQDSKLQTMGVVHDQLRADNAIQAEHLRLRNEEIARQARELAVLKAALSEEKAFSSALYTRLIKQAEVLVEKDEEIAALEVDADYWLDEAIIGLEMFYSAESEVVEFTSFIRSDPVTMAVLDGTCEDKQVEETIVKRLFAAQDEGELWYNVQMQRMKLE